MFFWRDPLSDADESPDTACTIFCPVHAVLGGMGGAGETTRRRKYQKTDSPASKTRQISEISKQDSTPAGREQLTKDTDLRHVPRRS
jgi:hypothetical protein